MFFMKIRNLLCFLFLLLSLFDRVLANSYEQQGPVDNVGGFVEGTIVHTFTGPDTIQNIRVNDRLLSFSPETGEIVQNRVTKVHHFQVDHIVKLVIGGETFYLNPDHRFFMPDTKEWIEAENLSVGTTLLSRNGSLLALEFKETIWGKEWLYDLTVEETENYFVGKNEILVHNFAFVIPVFT